MKIPFVLVVSCFGKWMKYTIRLVVRMDENTIRFGGQLFWETKSWRLTKSTDDPTGPDPTRQFD
jgi:hypothetical protein